MRRHELAGVVIIIVAERSGPLIALGARERVGLFEGLLAVGLVWTKTMAGDVFPVKEFARAAVRESNLVAAALRDDLVPMIWMRSVMASSASSGSAGSRRSWICSS